MEEEEKEEIEERGAITEIDPLPLLPFFLTNQGRKCHAEIYYTQPQQQQHAWNKATETLMTTTAAAATSNNATFPV